MKRMHIRLILATIALLSMIPRGTTIAEQPPDNVQGDWTIYSTSIETGETVVKHVQIAQYGNRITGYFEGPDQSGPIEGEVNAHNIRFSTVTRNVLTFRGQIYGDNMTGSYGLHGKHAAWQALRTPPVAQTAPPETGTIDSSQPVPTPASPAPAPEAPTEAPSEAGPPTGTQGSAAPSPAPMSSEQLNALVAPIALYPDSLVAQVLAAATFPDQVAIADYWLTQNSSLTPTALAQAVDQQSWDPSVKALTQFPSVLHDLARNLAWTSSLGQAFSNQQSDVMAAVQVMRAKAEAAGTLQSSPQIAVTQPSANVIVIQPANPQVVYVPQYNPTIVYGAPMVVPLYTPPVSFAAAAVSFGSGVSIGAFFGGGGGFVAGGGLGWGFHAWACNWGGGGNTIIYNHTTYITNNTWRNNNYNGYHPWGPANTAYHPGTDTHFGPNGAFHPNGYYGPGGHFHHDVPGTNPNHQPNGGNNGNHGLIGGNGGVRDKNAGLNGPGVAPNGGYHDRNENRVLGDNQSRMSGNGAANRLESERGRGSMAGRRPAPHVARQHAPAAHRSSGGGRRR
jgi:Protein of unknown function (DUF3300)